MRDLASTMHAIADDVPVPPLPSDLWRRGRRRHRRRLVAAVAAGAAGAVAVIAVVVPVTLDRPDPARPADTVPARPVVPSSVSQPWPWQRTVQDAPAGPAAMIASGEGMFAGSSDGYEGRTVVIGRDGRYRVVNGADKGEVGNRTHLSPDGRYLAVTGPVDDAGDVSFGATSLVDLVTGRVREIRGGRPIGWEPDSRHLLVHDPEARRTTRANVVTGSAVALSGLDGVEPVPPYVAFAPDGSTYLVATAIGTVTWEPATNNRATASYGRGVRLAGPSAWTDLDLIAFWQTVSGCDPACDRYDGAQGEFRLVFANAGGGGMASVTDFDQVSGLMPRLLGWLPDGSAVVEVRVSTGFMADYPAVPIYRTEVLALAPGGGRRELIGLPGNVHHVEVARDLVTAGRFGAAPAPTAARFADWARGLLPHLFVVVVAVAALVGWRAWRRKLRDLGRPVAPWRHQTSKIAERLTRAASGHPPRP